jgi:hypothetical protein
VESKGDRNVRCLSEGRMLSRIMSFAEMVDAIARIDCQLLKSPHRRTKKDPQISNHHMG